MREHDKQVVKAANARQMARLRAGEHPTWTSKVLLIPCEGPLSIIDMQCNASAPSSNSPSALDRFTAASCSAVNFRYNAGALLLLGDDSSAYRHDFTRCTAHSIGLGHASTTRKLLEPDLMSWDSLYLSDAPPFNTMEGGFRELRRNSYLEGVRGPVVVAPNICKQYECGSMALAFLGFPADSDGGAMEGLEWRALFEQVAATIVEEYTRV